MLAAMCAVTVLAGCAYPNRMNTAAGQAAPSSSPTVTGCPDKLVLGWDDNGSTSCVRLGGQVAVDSMTDAGFGYSGTDQTGSSLTRLPLPLPGPGWSAFKATSKGTTVIFGNLSQCVDTGPCATPPPWSVTIVVK